MEKTSVLKARVEEQLEAAFLTACSETGRKPATVLRELVERHVAEHRSLKEEDVDISINRPDGYDYGAWRVHMKLRNPGALAFMGAPIPFKLPQLAARRIHPEKGFAVAATNWDRTGSGLDGIFLNGVWEGDLYSNGVAEDENPTSLKRVTAALRASVAVRLRGSEESNDGQN